MLTSSDLANMRGTQDLYMQDRCQIGVYSAGTQDAYGQPTPPTYTAGSEIACGLDMRSGSERHGAQNTVITYDATLRLPINTSLKETDRIIIIKRYGEDTTDLTYEIASPIQRGASGIRVLLSKVVV